MVYLEVSKVIRDCIGALLRSVIGRSNCQWIFPHLTPVTCICFEFSLAPWSISLCSDWP